MLVFGHVGFTLGAAVVLAQIRRSRRVKVPGDGIAKDGSLEKSAWVKPIAGLEMSRLDVLFCILGSMLPDIIDKPVGHFLFSDVFGNNGRIFSHTLLFALIILGIGLYLYRVRKATWALFLIFGVFMHLILDFMWQTPQTLLWPLLGVSFPRGEEYDWIGEMIRVLLHDPLAFIPEIIGAFVLGAAVLLGVRSQKPKNKV